MQSALRYCQWQSSSAELPPWEVGGKAKGLRELALLGMKIPRSWILNPSFVKDLVRRFPRNESSEALQHLWKEMIADGSRRFVVRSSAADEDQHGKSLAGQYMTVLDVRTKEALVGAIETVFASISRRTTGSVILQPFVESAFSGVAFSIEPVLGDPLKYVIEFSSGPTDVVSGVSARRVIYNRATRRFDVKQTIDEAVMVEDVVASLNQLVTKIEHAVDIEWCWPAKQSRSGASLVLLQCRPALVRIEGRRTGPTTTGTVGQMIARTLSGRGAQL